MKRLRYFFIIFLAISYYFLAATHIFAAPPAPFSEEGNPDDQYQLTEIFPLLRFIKPPSLIVFENQDYSRQYKDCSETSYFQGSCTDNSACIGTSSCGNTTGTCNIPSGSTSGTCSYPKKNPTIVVDPKGTDFSRDSSAPHDPDDISYFLAFPKYQNAALRYDNICDPKTNNPISCGADRLILDSCEQAARRLMVAYQAYETFQTVSDTQEWPLGWVDWGYTTSYHNKNLLKIWEQDLAPVFGNIAPALVHARDQFFATLNDPNATFLMDDDVERVNLCNLVNTSPATTPWYQALSAVPMNPPSYRAAFTRGSICVKGICLPGASSNSSQTLYADPVIHQAFTASLYDFFHRYPLSLYLQMLREIAQNNQLIRFVLNTTPAATPSRLAKNKSLQSYGPEEFTFGTLGNVYDYLDDEEKNPYGYILQPKDFSQEEAGAFTESIVSQVINFAYGLVDSSASVTNHLITIPDPLGQLIFQFQEPVYRIRDTITNLENDKYPTMSNIADSGSGSYLFAGNGLVAGDARRRMAYFTCNDPYYSDPDQTSVLAYATGTRIYCADPSEESETRSTEVNCDQSVPEQNLAGLNVEEGKRLTDSLFQGCVGNSAWMQCHNDVIKRANEAGVDPLFSLAIWIHESGASNYECGEKYHGGIKIQDFGYNIPDLAENFDAQIKGFLALPSSSTYTSCGNNMNEFISVFWFGDCYNEVTAEQQDLVAVYISALNWIYSIISPGATLPNWP